MNAIRRRPPDTLGKDAEPTLVFLGRLKSTKKPEDAIEIFRKVKRQVPEARLWMLGSGPLEKELRKEAEGLGDVTFWGWVNDEQKMSLLRRAHILIVPSVREGFGINVIEAASAGTPAIGYNVPGLRDSIQHGKTGYLVGSDNEAASRIVELLTDPAAYERMSRNSLDYSKGFDWRKRVDEFWEIIKDCRSS
jgi:glycosyltransferase involved in cell wall biosynthesis